MMPEVRIGGGSRSMVGVDLHAHPGEAADVYLPAAGPRFSVLRPTLILPAGVRVSVASDMPYDVAARWWDSVTVSATMASQWYASHVNGWPSGKQQNR
ncbi:energy transducer TonB [Frankia tisae]|uniref:energy transducer TonB n=1 Tax=Frankia tisae TaxID=2950104 RepID=UPI0021BF57DD|nr:energy transducer TonB [Frankia tisae]